MEKKFPLSIIFLALCLFAWVNLPTKIVETLRALSISCFYFPKKPLPSDAVSMLQIENERLKLELKSALEWLYFDRHIEGEIGLFKELKADSLSSLRVSLIKNHLEKELHSVPARVIYRDPSSWSSTIWVNVGEEDNEALGRKIISKNSPVLSEGALVGIVEDVNRKQSQVRLITDSSLCPAVRVQRGLFQNKRVIQSLDFLLSQLALREDLFSFELEKEHLLSSLKEIRKKLGGVLEDRYLAKGELHGSSQSLWRSLNPTLKGVGFNYQFQDELGEAAPPVISKGDLLVTSGLDGVFPLGIPVGTVVSTSEVKKASPVYDIEVKPVSSSFNDLESVFILPSFE